MQKVYSSEIWRRATHVMRSYDHFTNNPGNIVKEETSYWLGQESEHLIVSAIGGCVLLNDNAFHRVMFMKYGYDCYMIVYRKAMNKPRAGGHDKPKFNIDYLVKFDDSNEGNKTWKTILASNTNDARTKYGAKVYKFTMPSNI